MSSIAGRLLLAAAAVVTALGAAACTQATAQGPDEAASAASTAPNAGIDADKYNAATAAVDGRLVASDLCTRQQKGAIMDYKGDLATTATVEVFAQKIQWFVSPADVSASGVVTQLTGILTRVNGTRVSFRRRLENFPAADPDAFAPADPDVISNLWNRDDFAPYERTLRLSQLTLRDDGAIIGELPSRVYSFALYRHEMTYREWAVSTPKTFVCYDTYNAFMVGR